MNVETQKVDVLGALDRQIDQTRRFGGWPSYNTMKEVREVVAELIEAATLLNSNKHLDIGDLVYQVREREGEGWDGPSVSQWSDAVTKLRAALARIGGAA